MRALSLSLLLVASCLDFSITKRNQDGGAGSAPEADAGSVDSGVFGAGCGTDAVTGVTLCAAISTCPGLTVDQGAFPGCGFRVLGTALDLECLCGDALCPIGVPTTCAQAKTLLQNQTQPLVCMQVNEGRCTTPAVKPPAGSCDKTCASECGGDPTCIKACGC